MFFKFLCFVGGASFVGLGYDTFVDGGWKSIKSGVFISYGELSKPIAILKICIGLFLISYSIFGKSSKREPYICPHCEEVVESLPESEIVCSSCATPMKRLKGYYDKEK